MQDAEGLWGYVCGSKTTYVSYITIFLVTNVVSNEQHMVVTNETTVWVNEDDDVTFVPSL